MQETLERMVARMRVLSAVLICVSLHMYEGVGAASPPNDNKLAVRHVNVAKMTTEEAEAAVLGERVCIKGKPVSPDSKLPSIELMTRDGNAYVHSVSLPGRVIEQCLKGYDVTIEFEGEIRRAPPTSFPFANRCYASGENRFAWDVRDSKGIVIERGESKIVNGEWVETSHPIDPSREKSSPK